MWVAELFLLLLVAVVVEDCFFKNTNNVIRNMHDIKISCEMWGCVYEGIEVGGGRPALFSVPCGLNTPQPLNNLPPNLQIFPTVEIFSCWIEQFNLENTPRYTKMIAGSGWSDFTFPNGSKSQTKALWTMITKYITVVLVIKQEQLGRQSHSFLILKYQNYLEQFVIRGFTQSASSHSTSRHIEISYTPGRPTLRWPYTSCGNLMKFHQKVFLVNFTHKFLGVYFRRRIKGP